MKTKIPWSAAYTPVTKSQLKKRIKVDPNFKIREGHLGKISVKVTEYDPSEVKYEL